MFLQKAKAWVEKYASGKSLTERKRKMSDDGFLSTTKEIKQDTKELSKDL